MQHQQIADHASTISAQTQTAIVIMGDGKMIIEQPEALHRDDNFNQHHEAPERLEGFHFVFFMRFMVNSKDLV
ncbi:MAG: hypothetical protein RLZ92_26 [Pseudomonadota bacterium]